MNIAFVTEMPFFGKPDPNNDNLRVPASWIVGLNADNIYIPTLEQIPSNSYDVAIIIIPKTLEKFIGVDILKQSKRIAKKVGFMQEGPYWYYQDMPLDLSFLFFEILSNVDFVLAHNESDKMYYEGIVEKPTFVHPSLMIEGSIGNLDACERNNVMVGGNFCRWYGGFDSHIIATEFDCDIYIPSMGRMTTQEKNIQDIKHLPYSTWREWIHALNRFKYGVHMMPTAAAGTFSLNCAYLGIPCIGNEEIDTQRICFPETSAHVMNIPLAKVIAKRLKNDKDFYDNVSKSATELYKKHYFIDVYKSKLLDILNTVIS